VQQALEAQPGISVNGDAPSSRQVRIRGGEASHTLVLIDGVRAAPGDTAFGGYFLRGLDTGYVERIEIVRGPQSVPFGTDASTGVINIITREAKDGLHVGGAIEFGEGDQQNAYFSHGSDSSRIAVNLSNSNDKGFDYSGDDGGNDGTRWETASSKGVFDLNEQTAFGFTLRAADGVYEYDDYDDYLNEKDTGADDAQSYVIDADNYNEASERAGSIYIDHYSLGGILGHRFRYDRTTEKVAFFPGTYTTDLKTEVVNYRLQTAIDRQHVESSDHLFSLLFEKREDSDRNNDQTRENDSVAVEYQGWLSSKGSMQAGLRRDFNTDFSDETTWNIAGSYYVQPDIRWHASAGRAVINPSFSEILGDSFGTDPNPDLAPEKNIGYDVGLELQFPNGDGFVDITYFNETLEDKITKVGTKNVNEGGESDRQGVELTTVFTALDSIDLSASYTYLDATNPDGETETRRPRNELGLGATWRSAGGVIKLSGDLRYVRGLFSQQRWEEGMPREQLPDFTVVNLASSYSITENIDLTARLTNAFDEDYQEVWGYATRGRAGYVGVRASW